MILNRPSRSTASLIRFHLRPSRTSAVAAHSPPLPDILPPSPVNLRYLRPMPLKSRLAPNTGNSTVGAFYDLSITTFSPPPTTSSRSSTPPRPSTTKSWIGISCTDVIVLVQFALNCCVLGFFCGGFGKMTTWWVSEGGEADAIHAWAAGKGPGPNPRRNRCCLTFTSFDVEIWTSVEAFDYGVNKSFPLGGYNDGFLWN